MILYWRIKFDFQYIKSNLLVSVHFQYSSVFLEISGAHSHPVTAVTTVTGQYR